MESIQDGEYLALHQKQHDGYDETVNLEPLPDDVALQAGGGWTPNQAQAAATQVTNDADAIAYIGDFDSGATATTLPITNRASILQVSPASSYIGLTDPNTVDQIGEPGRYYPSNTRTFARLVPSDAPEAVAAVQFMRGLMHDVATPSVYVLSDSSPYNGAFDSAIAPLVTADAQHAGIRLAGSAQIDSATTTTTAGYASVAAAIAASHAAAVYVAGVPDAGTVALWRELYSKLPGTALIAPSTLAIGPFLDQLRFAAASTFFTSPILPLDQYPRRARLVYDAYRHGFKNPPWSPYVLYGYEAMESILDTINIVGTHASDRLRIIHTYFHLGYRDKSVIGRYRIDGRGDTSLTRFEGYRVSYSGARIPWYRLQG
jgi:branched-chain amino acid transport system substrate-binding protein